MSEDKARAEGARRVGPALEKAYQFVRWLIPTLDKFPRSQRFVLGDRIEKQAQRRRNLDLFVAKYAIAWPQNYFVAPSSNSIVHATPKPVTSLATAPSPPV